jgi:hypothetical protein
MAETLTMAEILQREREQILHHRLNPPGQMRLLPYEEWLERVKKVKSVLVEVRVNWKTTSTEYSDQQYWKMYKKEINVKWYRSVSHLSPTGGIDALWEVLTRCLPFAQWRQCDFTTLDYEAYAALKQIGLWAQFAGVSSYKLDDVDDRISEDDMKDYCWEEQDSIIKDPLFRHNAMPKTLLVVLYEKHVKDHPKTTGCTTMTKATNDKVNLNPFIVYDG